MDHHVVADCMSFATTFLQKSSLGHFVASSFQIGPVVLGIGLVLAVKRKQGHLCIGMFHLGVGNMTFASIFYKIQSALICCSAYPSAVACTGLRLEIGCES